ncbi:hypothetical protein AB205_0034350 [Aquarana catesbeiana]|uniref:Eukaryotic translation initiation factor 2A n=1 Tax=Aquarana catesbeiana TaxID=8400 RepID=A0A2G9REC6_AQUCT|nr:hypothetical protein AB205_0034350 [Aquarana catesbeiana]
MQKRSPCRSEDEKICARNVNKEVHFFEDNIFGTIAILNCHLEIILARPGHNVMEFKATAVLVTASTDVDKKREASYYGEQTLHYIAGNGKSAVVQLPKNGPIYDVVWDKNSTEFCAVYGFMSAKATVLNLKCDPIFDFGTGPRNAAFYSPQGHILVLAGFGNLRGQMEVWDIKNYKLISKPTASDATYFAWCPNGENIVTASPRLRTIQNCDKCPGTHLKIEPFLQSPLVISLYLEKKNSRREQTSSSIQATSTEEQACH